MSEEVKAAVVFRHYFDNPAHEDEFDQYKQDRKLFDDSTGIICPIRAIVLRNGKGNKSSNSRTNDFYKDTMESLLNSLVFFHKYAKEEGAVGDVVDVLEPTDYVEYFKSISSTIGYFAACVSDMSVKLTYSLCAWPDIIKFDPDYG